MKTKSVKRAITAIALMLAVSMSANAQLGGALKKAAEKAKSEVKKETSEKATEKVTEKAVEAAPESVKQAVPESVKQAAPQAEEEKYSPWDTNYEIEPGDENIRHAKFVHSLAEIKKSYRKLNPKIYSPGPGGATLLKKFDELFTEGSQINTSNLSVFRGITAHDDPDNPTSTMDSKYIMMATSYITVLEYAFALYQIEPTSYIAYDLFTKARYYLDWMEEFKKTPTGSKQTRGIYTPGELEMWQKERKRIEDLHLTPYTEGNDVTGGLKDINAPEYNRAQAMQAIYKNDILKYLETDAQANAAFSWGLYKVATSDIQTAPGYDPNGTLAKAIEERIKEFTDKGVDKMSTSYFAASVKEMPKTFAMDAASTTGLNSVAKEEFATDDIYKGKTFVKAVFINNAWNELKSGEWPYKVVMRSINSAIIVKNAAGKYEMFTGQLVQARKADGWGKYEWRFGAFGEGKPRLVNYK